jgi:hypothetical protein
MLLYVVNEKYVSPYRVPARPQHIPAPPAVHHRRTDALDIIFWAIVTTLGLAVASGRSSVTASPAAQEHVN